MIRMPEKTDIEKATEELKRFLDGWVGLPSRIINLEIGNGRLRIDAEYVRTMGKVL